MKNLKLIVWKPWGLYLGTFILYICGVYVNVKVEAKIHQLPILVIVIVFLVLSTNMCTEMVILED